jgi:hypothetical protein
MNRLHAMPSSEQVFAQCRLYTRDQLQLSDEALIYIPNYTKQEKKGLVFQFVSETFHKTLVYVKNEKREKRRWSFPWMDKRRDLDHIPVKGSL